MSRRTAKQERLIDLGYGALGIVLFLAAWELIGRYKLAGMTWPPLSTVVAFLFDPSKQGLLGRAAAATFSSAAMGYAFGAALGIALAGVAHSVRPLQEGLGRLASFINAIPAIALAPIFIVTVSANWTGMALSLINVFFITYIAASSGLNATTKSHRDLFTTLGASRWNRFLRLELPAALPALISGLRYSVPAALIGTIIGEWFGASRGIGLLIVSSMQNFQIPLLWSAMVLSAGASLLVYGLMSLPERIIYARFRP